MDETEILENSENEPKTFTCDECDKSFQSSRSLINHRNAMHKKKESSQPVAVDDLKIIEKTNRIINENIEDKFNFGDDQKSQRTIKPSSIKNVVTNLIDKRNQDKYTDIKNQPDDLIDLDLLTTKIMSRIDMVKQLDAQFLPPSRDNIHVMIKQLPNYHASWGELYKATDGSVGFDVRAAISSPVCLGLSSWVRIPLGFAMALPKGYFALMCPRSGLADKHGVTVLNAPGVIDSDYRGEMCAIMVNNTSAKYWIQPGERIAQFIILKSLDVIFETVDDFDMDTVIARGVNGFGSSGKF